MARTPKTDAPAPLMEARQGFTSAWLEQHSGRAGAIRKGTLLRADDPIVKTHPDEFLPARADYGEGKHADEFLVPLPEAT